MVLGFAMCDDRPSNVMQGTIDETLVFPVTIRTEPKTFLAPGSIVRVVVRWLKYQVTKVI